MIKYLKDILPLQKWLVKSKMSQSILTNEDDAATVVSEIKDFKVTKGCYRQLGVNNSLTGNVMDAVAALFQLRDDRISDSHQSVNRNRHGYRLWKRSIFLGPSFWRLILEGNIANNQIKDDFFFGADWNAEHYQYIYMFVNSFDAASVDPWALIQIDLVTHKIEYLDGRINGRQLPVHAELVQFLQLVKMVLKPLLLFLIPEYTNEWHCDVHRETYFELLDNQFDSGIYVAATTYFLSVGVPLFFERNSIVRLRMNLAYWMLVGELPI